MVRRDNEIASRERIARCAISRLELPDALGTNGTNPLDDIFNEDIAISKGRQIKTAEELIECVTRKRLGCSSDYGLSAGGGTGMPTEK